MKRIGYHGMVRNACWTLAGLLTLTSIAAATPAINGAVLKTRIFNDCPSSILTTVNGYPASIVIDDAHLDCFGFANLHNWSLSDDGGSTAAVFNNGDSFKLSAELVLSGATDCEGGLRISPWWSKDADGRFNVRTTDGEIACFGGRLPFYSFTGSHGITYTKGTPILLEVIYKPNGLSAADPATIEYNVTYAAINYSSGPLPFDEGNPAEDPPYGLWGMLNDARVGGYVQVFLVGGNPNAQARAEWRNIQFMEMQPVPAKAATWGRVKGLYR